MSCLATGLECIGTRLEDFERVLTMGTGNAGGSQGSTVRGLDNRDLWNTHPKNYGKGGRSCRITGNQNGLIRKYPGVLSFVWSKSFVLSSTVCSRPQVRHQHVPPGLPRAGGGHRLQEVPVGRTAPQEVSLAGST